MNYSKYISIWLIVFSSASCTKELPFPDVQADPELVVNSLFSPEGELIVHVSQSCHLANLKCELNFVDNATVSLLDESGGIIGNLEHVSEGVYTLSNNPIEYGKEYQVEVSANNTFLKSITSKSYVPASVKSKVLDIAEKEIGGYLTWAFDVEIEDDPAVDNYYVITGEADVVLDPDNETASETNGYLEPLMKHFSDDPNSDNNEIAFAIDFVPYPLKAVYLTDKHFNGKTYKTTVGINVTELMYSGAVGKLISEIQVQSVSKEMYEYLTSIEEKNLRIADPFSEPVQVYSNIDNGIGIFAGYAPLKIPITLPESDFGWPEDVRIENEGCTAPCTVSFLTIGGGSKLSYRWDFGDGNTSNEKNTEHQYDEPGMYEIIYEANRVGGGWGSNFNIEIR